MTDRSVRTVLDRNNTSFPIHLFEFFKAAKWDETYDFLHYYQNLVRVFMREAKLDSRGLLIDHQMGFGKSVEAIAIVMDALQDSGRQPIILSTKSLQENMRGTIHKYVKMRAARDQSYPLGRLSTGELDNWIDKNFAFVSMNAGNMLRQMGKAAEGHFTDEFDSALESKLGEITKLRSLDGKILVVDEAHNLFRAITNGSKNAMGVYDMVMRAKDLVVVFLTGTPIANDPFELVPCFNMLGGKHPILPESYRDFTKMFVGPDGNIINKAKLQNRILGLVSYLDMDSRPGAGLGVVHTGKRGEFPRELPYMVKYVSMDPEQYVMYSLARDKEKEEGTGKFGQAREPASMTKPKGKASSTYRVKSRQLSNYCPGRGDAESAPIDSPKYRAMYEVIESRRGQLGLMYSQFTGSGGIGSFTRFLEQKGWKRIRPVGPATPAAHVSPARERNSNAKALAEYEKQATGEQGELDEYVVHPAKSGAEDNCAAESSVSSSALPSVDGYFRSVQNVSWGYSSGNVTGAYDGYMGGAYGYDYLDTSSESESDEEYVGGDEHLRRPSCAAEPMRRTIPGGVDEVDKSLTAGVITFEYVRDVGALDALRKINPSARLDESMIRFPHYVLLVRENDEPIGYVTMKYEITEHTVHINGADTAFKKCRGRMTDYYFLRARPALTGAVFARLMEDAAGCQKESAEFRKRVWGGREVRVGGASVRNAPGRESYFAVIAGDVPIIERNSIKDMMVSPDNAHGGMIDLLCISATGAEGLDLKNIRYILITEPYWNWGRIAQVGARGIRNDSHIALPETEKDIQVYIFLAVPPETERLADGTFPETTDTELYNESVKNRASIESFTEALKEVSIECLVNGGGDKCRRCNPTDKPLFTDNIDRDIIGPDPCTQLQEHKVQAREILVGGERYMYAAAEESLYGYDVFIYDTRVDGWRKLSESDPRFGPVIDAILAGIPVDKTAKK